MVPARRTCPEGWGLEYEGVLMSQGSGQEGSDFVCVSVGMQALRFGPYRNEIREGGQLFVVEAKCGTLPCPFFAQGVELSCVVCSK